MSELLGASTFIAAIVFILMAVLLPFSAYAGQKWAYRSYQELIKANRKLEALLQEQRQLIVQLKEAVTKSASGTQP